MSTKCTLSYDKERKLEYHLYQECYENDNVWLQLDDAKEFEVWRTDDKTRVRLAIPVEIFRHMVEGWLASEWGKDPSMDHHKMCQEEWDNFGDSLKMLAERKSSD